MTKIVYSSQRDYYDFVKKTKPVSFKKEQKKNNDDTPKVSEEKVKEWTEALKQKWGGK